MVATSPKKLGKECFVQRIGLRFIDARQTGSTDPANTGVIKLVLLRTQVGDDVTQASPAGKLTDEHCNELAPAGHFPKLLAFMVFFGQGFKFMSIHQSEELR